MEFNKKLFKTQEIFFKSVGMQFLDCKFLPENLCFLKPVINISIQVFWHFTLIHFAVFQIQSVLLNWDKTIDDIVDYLLIGSIYVYAYICILCYWTYNAGKLTRLYDFMIANFHLRSAKGLTFISFEEGVRVSKKYMTVWCFCCVGGTLSWIFYPLVKCITCKLLPLKSWYPIDVNSFPNYEIAFILQLFGQIFIGIGYGNCGGLYMTFVFMLCGQYDMLYVSLKNLGKARAALGQKDFSEKQKSIEFEDQELNQYLISVEQMDTYDKKKMAKTIRDEFVACVKHHQMILEFNKRLEDLFRWFLFTKIFYSGVLVCLIAYVLSTVDEFSVVKLMNLGSYLGLSTSEVLLFGYVSEILKRHSTRAGEALMRSNWHEIDQSVKSSMLFFMTCAVRPCIMTAGKMYNVDIEQYRTVMGTAFSYYTLLKNINKKI